MAFAGSQPLCPFRTHDPGLIRTPFSAFPASSVSDMPLSWSLWHYSICYSWEFRTLKYRGDLNRESTASLPGQSHCSSLLNVLLSSIFSSVMKENIENEKQYPHEGKEIAVIGIRARITGRLPFSKGCLMSVTAHSWKWDVEDTWLVSRAREQHTENTNPLHDEIEEVKNIESMFS